MKAMPLVLLLVVGNDLGSSLQGAIITGQVVDARTMQPLRGAIVAAARVPSDKPGGAANVGYRTGAGGKFILRGVAPGVVDFFVTKAGYVSGPFKSVRPAADGERIDDVVLAVPPAASVGGRVLDESGHAIVDATVTVSPAIPSPPGAPSGTRPRFVRWTVKTDDDGQYWVGGLSAGEYGITVGQSAEPAAIVAFGEDLLINSTTSGLPPGGRQPKVTLATGEDRRADLLIRLGQSFTIGPPRPREPGTATVSGQIVDTRGLPVAHATAVLSQTDKGASMMAAPADATGRFEFEAVPAGSFRLGALRTVFTAGVSVGADELTPLQVAAGTRIENLVLTIARGGTISGTLTDEFGDPVSGSVIIIAPSRPDVSGQTVTLSRFEMAIISGRGAAADARGRYRITGLPPRDYLVAVDPATAPLPDTEVYFEDQTGQERKLASAPVFFPAASTASQASKVSVSEGNESRNVDVVVRPVPVASINVTVTSARPVGEIQLSRILLDAQMPILETATKMTGSSVTLDARPGSYRLFASAEVGSSADNVVRLWSSVDIDVDPAFPAIANLVLEPGANIAGRIIFEGGNTNRQNAGASLVPIESLAGVRIPMLYGTSLLEPATGLFSIEGAMPGRYMILAGGAERSPGGLWMLKAATVGGRDVLDDPIDLRPGEEITDARLIVTDRINELTGTVTDAAGKPDSTDWVIVFSTDKKHWSPGSRRTRLVRPDATGLYRLRALPAGNYVVTTIRDAIGLRQDDFLARLPTLAGTGVRVTIAEGERKVQDLRVK